MKRLLILLLSVLLFSCSNRQGTKPFDTHKVTTMEIVNLAKLDSSIYHVAKVDGTLYVLNKDYLVVDKMKDYSGDADTAWLFFLIVLMVFFIFILIID
jgi:hypothetical protein